MQSTSAKSIADAFVAAGGIPRVTPAEFSLQIVLLGANAEVLALLPLLKDLPETARVRAIEGLYRARTTERVREVVAQTVLALHECRVA